MSRVRWIVWVVGTLALMPFSGFAAEHGGQEHGGASQAPASNATTASGQEQSGQATASVLAPVELAPATPAAAPEPAEIPPALKPITITFSGDLLEVDAGAAPAVMTVQDRYGVKKQMEVPSDAKIAQGTDARALADLKVGDKLTVEYTYEVATGKRTAKSITVGEAAPAAP